MRSTQARSTVTSLPLTDWYHCTASGSRFSPVAIAFTACRYALNVASYVPASSVSVLRLASASVSAWPATDGLLLAM